MSKKHQMPREGGRDGGKALTEDFVKLAEKYSLGNKAGGTDSHDLRVFIGSAKPTTDYRDYHCPKSIFQPFSPFPLSRLQHAPSLALHPLMHANPGRLRTRTSIPRSPRAHPSRRACTWLHPRHRAGDADGNRHLQNRLGYNSHSDNGELSRKTHRPTATHAGPAIATPFHPVQALRPKCWLPAFFAAWLTARSRLAPRMKR